MGLTLRSEGFYLVGRSVALLRVLLWQVSKIPSISTCRPHTMLMEGFLLVLHCPLRMVSLYGLVYGLIRVSIPRALSPLVHWQFARLRHLHKKRIRNLGLKLRLSEARIVADSYILKHKKIWSFYVASESVFTLAIANISGKYQKTNFFCIVSKKSSIFAPKGRG